MRRCDSATAPLLSQRWPGSGFLASWPSPWLMTWRPTSPGTGAWCVAFCCPGLSEAACGSAHGPGGQGIDADLAQDTAVDLLDLPARLAFVDPGQLLAVQQDVPADQDRVHRVAGHAVDQV